MDLQADFVPEAVTASAVPVMLERGAEDGVMAFPWAVCVVEADAIGVRSEATDADEDGEVVDERVGSSEARETGYPAAGIEVGDEERRDVVTVVGSVVLVVSFNAGRG